MNVVFGKFGTGEGISCVFTTNFSVDSSIQHHDHGFLYLVKALGQCLPFPFSHFSIRRESNEPLVHPFALSMPDSLRIVETTNACKSNPRWPKRDPWTVSSSIASTEFRAWSTECPERRVIGTLAECAVLMARWSTGYETKHLKSKTSASHAPWIADVWPHAMIVRILGVDF